MQNMSTLIAKNGVYPLKFRRVSYHMIVNLKALLLESRDLPLIAGFIQSDVRCLAAFYGIDVIRLYSIFTQQSKI